ncbi:MAG: hypothetical protein ACI94Y_000749 [Maribacter sp.]|jgi:hypothetical protein
MKSFKYLFIIMFATAALVGCKKKASVDEGDTTTPEVSTGIDFDAMAKEMCDCTNDLINILEKQKALTAAEKTEDLLALTTEMAPKAEKMGTCITALQAKYPGIDGDEAQEAKATAALTRNCPGYARIVESMGVN